MKEKYASLAENWKIPKIIVNVLCDDAIFEIMDIVTRNSFSEVMIELDILGKWGSRLDKYPSTYDKEKYTGYTHTFFKTSENEKEFQIQLEDLFRDWKTELINNLDIETNAVVYNMVTICDSVHIACDLDKDIEDNFDKIISLLCPYHKKDEELIADVYNQSLIEDEMGNNLSDCKPHRTLGDDCKNCNSKTWDKKTRLWHCCEQQPMCTIF